MYTQPGSIGGQERVEGCQESVKLVGRHRVILPIGGVHRGSLAALAFARTLSDDVTAVYISIDPVEAEKVRSKWETWGGGVRLVALDSSCDRTAGWLECLALTGGRLLGSIRADQRTVAKRHLR
jgi:hypothetical protein